MAASGTRYLSMPYAANIPSAPDMADEANLDGVNFDSLQLEDPRAGDCKPSVLDDRRRQYGHVTCEPEASITDEPPAFGEECGERDPTAPGLEPVPEPACNGLCMPPCYQCVVTNPQYSDGWIAAADTEACNLDEPVLPQSEMPEEPVKQSDSRAEWEERKTVNLTRKLQDLKAQSHQRNVAGAFKNIFHRWGPSTTV